MNVRIRELSIVYVISLALCILAQWNAPIPYWLEFSYIFVLLAFLGLPFFAIRIFRQNNDEDGLLRIDWSSRDAVYGLVTVLIIFIPVALGAYLWYVHIVGGSFHFAWQNYDRLEHSVLYAISIQLLLVALPEEFFYRNYLQGSILSLAQKRMGAKKSAGIAIFITSLLFALGHALVYLNPMRMNVFFPSLLFGYLRLKTKTLTACIIVHAGANLMMQGIGVHFFI